MFKRLTFILIIFIAGCTSTRDYPITPVPFTQVKFMDNFWKPRLETNSRITIPYIFEMDESTGRVDNLRKAAGLMEGAYEGRRFNDSDVFKAMEAAAYSLSSSPDPALEREMDSLIDIIGKAQEEDGYLYAARTVDPSNPVPGAGSERWNHLQGSHELYNVGHMYEAAAAYYQATGKRKFLDIAEKNAGLIMSVFGPGRRRDTSGHQEIEIGLAKLFRITGNRNYLDMARFFLDERGRTHDHEPYPDSVVYAIYNSREYRQDHLPVLEQTEAVGHSVRAAYQYAAMADIAALTGDKAYIRAIDRIWDDVAFGKLYLTGGIGARHISEAFGEDYELPNLTAYTETCAAVGNVFWNLRMFLLHGQSKYYDVLERTLYNGLLSGVSLKGDRFFYQNPLESEGGVLRSDWFACSCCPGNIARLLPALPGYVYATRGKTVYVNLYVANEADFEAAGRAISVSQKTDYPWDGEVRIAVQPESPADLRLALRIPGWATGSPVPGDLYHYENDQTGRISLEVNGESRRVFIIDGYAVIEREWKAGDTVVLNLPMPVRTVISHENIEENRGRIAFERGPIVYCAESVDNPGIPAKRAISKKPVLKPEFSDILNGIVWLKSPELTLIPYYAWANRGDASMAVWLPVKETL